MKIYLYNKYLATSGGGEKHAGGIAEVLSQKHDVSILYSGEVNIEKLSAKLNLDLSRVSFVSFGSEEDIDFCVLDYVKDNKPDIFINATYFSSLLTSAPINISLIFFPKFNLTNRPSHYDQIVHAIGKLFFKAYCNTVRFHEGFHHEELINYKLGRWSSKASTLLITKPFRKLKVYYTSLDSRITRDVVKSIKIHNNKLNFSILPERLEFNNLTYDANGIHLKFNSFKPSESNRFSSDSRDLGLFVNMVDTDAHNIWTRLIILLWRQNAFNKAFNRIYVKWTIINEYNYYRKFLASNLNLSNSDYTSSWIQKIYGIKEIEVQKLYPPVDVEHFYNSALKENIILCVGRFFVGGHNKKQIELIKAFKRAYHTHNTFKNFRLVLCGGSHPEKHHQDYLELCRLSAQGYPIEICADIPFKKLIEYYGKSKIFWHAAGMHENENLSPDKFEHFGITTVEAKAAGCVPVVIGVAGQKEIVSHMYNGVLWNTEQELIDSTHKLILDEKLRLQLSTAAIKSSSSYSRKKFDDRVLEIFDRYMH